MVTTKTASYLPQLSSKLKISKFLRDSEVIEDISFVTNSKGNVFTTTTYDDIAYLPSADLYNVQVGTLITANNKTRYVLAKNSDSIKLNKEVNWNNVGNGYSFKYYNPIAHMLNPSQDIIGYITRDGLLYLSDELMDLKVNKIIANDSSNGIQILNSDNYGIYISADGVAYKGTEGNWEQIDFNETLIANYVSNYITQELDLSDLNIDGGYF